MNLLTEWLKTKNLKDAQIRVGNVVFHLPFDGKDYLLHKCRRCGRCCKGQLYNALMLTMGDIIRLSKTTKCGMSPSQFIERMCIFGTINEGQEIRLPFYPQPYRIEYTACFLKRYPEESAESLTKPHPCRHITDQNLCDIYESRPVTCRKFPYTTFHKDGLTHACYVDVPYSDCVGYFTRSNVNKKVFSRLASILEKGDVEIRESIEQGLIIITHLTET